MIEAAETDEAGRRFRERKVQDVWTLGRHTYIYEAELEALISNECG